MESKSQKIAQPYGQDTPPTLDRRVREGYPVTFGPHGYRTLSKFMPGLTGPPRRSFGRNASRITLELGAAHRVTPKLRWSMDTNPCNPIHLNGYCNQKAPNRCICAQLDGKMAEMIDKTTKTILEQVQRLAKLGVPNTKIAERAGVHRNTVRNWLNGANVPRADRTKGGDFNGSSD